MAALPLIAAAQPAYRRQDVMVPMRDGVRLETVLFIPNGPSGPWPVLLQRTPYGVPPAGVDHPPGGPAVARLERDGYIFAFQSVRGRGKSEGTFEMARPPRDHRRGVRLDETTDDWDAVDWLAHQLPDGNGRVGLLGSSDLGWAATLALVEPHPALKAVCEQGAPADPFVGDDFHHYGAFRLYFGFDFIADYETDPSKVVAFDYGPPPVDAFDWFLRLGSLANANRLHFHRKLPSWNAWAAHPNRDAYWLRQAVTEQLRGPTVPILNVAGWYDQEDLYGPLAIYRALEQRDPERRNYLLVGPWNHGGWWGTGQKLGPLELGADPGQVFAESQARWFAHWLRGAPELDLPEATVFETGSNRWRRLDAWPPPGTERLRLYLRADGALSAEPPGDDGADAFVSDPADPVPFRPRPITPLSSAGPEWSRWLLEDQRFLQGRADVLSYRTEPLERDLVLSGPVQATLWASTTGRDADWVVKLIDVFPEDAPAPMAGYQLIVASEILRGRFREDLAHPRPVPPNHAVEYRVDLGTRAHAFGRGHRVMVQVQSTWFPLYDRNPQSWVENIFQARPEDFIKAKHRVLRGKAAPSSVLFTVAPGAQPRTSGSDL